MKVVLTDGGRAQSGFKGKLGVGDCVTRAIAIATERPYREVYDELARRSKLIGHPRSARNGVSREVYQPYLAERGWEWTPTMGIGTGCKVHLRAEELPPGRLIVRTSRHITTVIDGVIHDDHDPSRGGTRCVYGFWAKG